MVLAHMNGNRYSLLAVELWCSFSKGLFSEQKSSRFESRMLSFLSSLALAAQHTSLQSYINRNPFRMSSFVSSSFQSRGRGQRKYIHWCACVGFNIWMAIVLRVFVNATHTVYYEDTFWRYCIFQCILFWSCAMLAWQWGQYFCNFF